MHFWRAFTQVSNLHAFGGDGERGGDGTVEGVVVVAVDMPAFLDDRRGHNGGALVARRVEHDVPRNGVVNAHRGRLVHPFFCVSTATVIGLGAFGLEVCQGHLEIDVLRGQALAFVADHEGQMALDGFRDGPGERQGVDPMRFLLEEEQVEHEVGVVFEDGLAFRGGGVGHLEPVRLEGEGRRNRSVKRVEELAVDMPSLLDGGVEVEVDRAVSIVVEVHLPLDRVVDLGHGGDGRSETEEPGEEEMQGLHGHVALRTGR